MKFEVEVGGRPVRFNKNLIFTARACEVSTPDELTEDAIAYLQVAVQSRGDQPGGGTASGLPWLDVRFIPRRQRPSEPKLRRLGGRL
jgi:hypothetical protein